MVVCSLKKTVMSSLSDGVADWMLMRIMRLLVLYLVERFSHVFLLERFELLLVEENRY